LRAVSKAEEALRRQTKPDGAPKARAATQTAHADLVLAFAAQYRYAGAQIINE
jgi:hypothetical protein